MSYPFARKKLLFSFIALTIIAGLFSENCLAGKDSSTAGGATEIVGLKTNFQVNPLGIETDLLCFGWKMQSDIIGQAQAAYQIRLTKDQPNGELVWDSGKVNDGTSVAVAYKGPALNFETRYYWTVTVTDVSGGVYVSKSAYFETGAVWGDAQWITISDFSADVTALLFRTEQALKGGSVTSARLYMTALGVYDAYINGKKVLLGGGNVVTAPGAQEPEISDTYQTYDVTDYIKGSDRITLGALVGNGYYGSAKGGYRDSYAIGKDDLRELCLLAKLVIRYTDGNDQIIVTSRDGWTVSDKTPLEANHLVKGEVYNAAIAKEIAGWNQSGYDVRAADWLTPQVLSNYSGVLHAGADSLIYDYKSTPFTDAYIYDPAQIIPGTDKDGSSPHKYGEVSGAIHYKPGVKMELKAGKILVLDFGQNCTSMPDIILSGPAGATLNMQPGETVSDGEGGGIQGPGAPQGGMPGGTGGGQGGMPQGGQGGMPQGGQSGMPQGMPQGGQDGFPAAGGEGSFPAGAMPGGFPGGGSTDNFPTEFDGTYTAVNAKDEVLKGVVGGRWVYKLAGSTSETPERYRAQFHYGGHRYLQLTSDQDIVIYDAKNIAVSSVGDETIYFESSNKYVDQFVSNTKWSQISNYISVPTDCPTREYRGWTGDANVFAATAFYTFESSALFHHYNTLLQEYCLNQYSGKPVYGNHHPSEDSMNGNSNGNGWTDVGIIFPWEYYQQTGDISVLEYSWKAMCAFMDNINAGTDFSDPKAPVFKYGYTAIGLGDHNNKDTAPTNSFLAAVYTYYDNLLMTKMARALSDQVAVKKYGDMATLGRRYMIKRYLDKDGNVLCATMDKDKEGDSRYDRVDNAQTALAWMILLDLYDTEEQLNGMTKNLSKSVRNKNHEVSENRGEYTLSVGFLGANVLMPALGKSGQLDAAYGLMTSTNPYGLIYSVTKPYVPATTSWEVWALWEEGTGYKSGESQNHYSYGAPALWLYQYVLGIARDEQTPGFKHFILQPTVDASLDYAEGSYDSYYGEIKSAWTADGAGNMISYRCTVPANTTATLYLPVDKALMADFKDIPGLTYLGREVHNGVSTAKFSVLSGRYELSFKTVNVPAVEKFAGKKESGFIEEFRNPPVAKRAKIRMWWPSADIGREQIASEIKQLYEAGFGGVELIGISESFGRGMVDAAKYGWATDNWNRAVETLMAETEKYGMKVDLTIGPRWPAGIPDLDPNSDSASRQLVSSTVVITDKTGSFKAPAPAFTPNSVITRQDLIAVHAARLIEEGKPVISEGRRGWGPSAETFKINTIPTTIDAASIIDITRLADDKHTVNWTPPDNNRWIIFAFWSRGTGQTSGDTDPVAYVIDHYSKAGTETIINFWNKKLLTPALKAHLAKYGGDLFEDSLELTEVDMPWSKDLPSEFNKRRGYNLIPYLPLLIGRTTGSSLEDKVDADGSITGKAGTAYKQNRALTLKNDTAGDRIFKDYHQVLNNMYIDNHIRPIMDWCQGVNLTFRVQPYQLGSAQTFDTAEAASIVGVVEGESLGFGDSIDYFRVLAGGAHMGGRLIVSDELGAYAGGAYNTTWQQLVESINLNVVGGVNQFVLHGFPTKAQSSYTAWPGWFPFADPKFAEPWSDRQPSFDHISSFVNYMSRLQMILQIGRSDMDLAVYRDSKAMGNGGSPVKYFSDTGLIRAGYTYEYLSPANLKSDLAIVKSGVLAPEGPSYKALIVNNENAMSLETAQNLLNYAQKGLPIIFIGKTPADTGYYGDRSDDEKLRKAVKDLLDIKTVMKVDTESEAVDALKTLNIDPDTEYSDMTAVPYAIHRTDSGNRVDIYSLYNNDKTPVKTAVALKGAGKPYSINPWSGEIALIAEYESVDGHVLINLALGQTESVIIGLTDTDYFGKAPSLHVLYSTGEVFYKNDRLVLRAVKAGEYITATSDNKEINTKIEIVPEAVNLSDWKLDVESWQPGPSALLAANDPLRNTHDIIKVRLKTISLTGLKPWSSIEGLAGISGRGLYTTGFNADNWDGAMLDLGETWDNILEIKVNNVTLPAIDQITRRIDISPYIKKGENALSILIGTTLKSAVNASGTNQAGGGIAPYNTTGYGLIGDIKVIPYVEEPIS